MRLTPTKQIREAADLVAGSLAAVSIDVPDEFQRWFSWHASRVRLSDFEDFGSIVFLECLEAVDRGESIDSDALGRVLDRVRHRLVRHSQRAPSHDMTESHPDRSVTPENVTAFVRGFCDAIRKLPPEYMLIFQWYFLDGREIPELRDVLGLSTATIYRRIAELKSAADEYLGD